MKLRIKLLIVISLVFIFLSVYAIKNQNSQWKGTIEEEDGVKIIKNPNEPLYGEITFDLEEDLSIGNEEDENYMFYEEVKMGVDKDGNIFALDQGNYRIQKYDRNGNYLQTIGRQGQGPGEFEDYFTFLYLDSHDNIYVLDNRRIHEFKSNGELIKTFNLFGLKISDQYRITKEGNIIGETLTGYSSNIDLFNSEGKFVKTIVTYNREGRNSSLKYKLPNFHEPRLLICGIDEELSVYGYSSEYKLFVINSSGNIVYKFEKDENPQPLTNDDKERVLNRFMERPMIRNWNRKFSRGEAKKAMNFPKYKPLFSDIIRDDKGQIYVKRFIYSPDENKVSHYDMFNKKGYYLYRVKIPVRFPLIKHGYIYTAEFNRDTGYAKIKRYKIKNWEQIREGF